MVASLLARSLRISAPRYSYRYSSAPSLLVRSLSTTRPTSFTASSRQGETGGVSQQPGSKTFKELGHNALEETKGIGKTVLGAVSGAQVGRSEPDSKAEQQGKEEAISGLGSLKSDVDSIIGIVESVPKDALIWGGLGVVPYAGTSLATVYLARQASQAVSLGESSGLNAETALLLLSQVQQIQIAYGAVLLSFLGAIHWGFEFSKYGGVVGNTRYTLGVIPSIVGAGSLLLAPQMALITQWAAFFATWYGDQKATSRGLTPKWYATYRFWLTAAVGSSILVTLGGESYFGPDRQTMETKSAMQKLGDKAGPMPTGRSADLGDFRIEKTAADAAEGYTTFSKIDHEAEEKKRDEDRREQEQEAKKQDAKSSLSQEQREAAAKRARSQSGVNG